jgi:acetyl esterase/lipase
MHASHSYLPRCPVLLQMMLAAVVSLNAIPLGLAESPVNAAAVPVPKAENDRALALKPLQPDTGSSSVVGAAAEPEKLALWSGQAPVGEGQFEPANASITVHRPPAKTANGAAIVICPGGGYGGLVVGPEGHGIAKWLNAHGIAGIVLEYRLPKGRPFVPLLDAQRAIRTVRFRAKDWNIDPHRIGIIGFSAGGHLASTAGTHFDSGDPQSPDPINRVSCRPDFAILIYPVVTMGATTHGGSKANLLGRDPKPELAKLFSNEQQVTGQTPPMFLAHAKNDALVTPDNSRMLYETLRANKVATEYLELPSGGHGLNGYKGPMWDAWQAKSLEWLAAQKMIPPQP